MEKYAHLAAFEEIAENDFNLNIPRYVDTFEEEEEIDIDAVGREIDQLEKELSVVRGEMGRLLQGINREGDLSRLFQSWEDEDDADEQRETLEHLIQALDENRPPDHKLFPKEQKGKSW